MATQAKTRTQIKFSRALKAAVHSGDGWDDYTTLVQFLNQKVALIELKASETAGRIDGFFEDGGTVDDEGEGIMHASFGGTELRAVFGPGGDVEEYTLSHARRSSVERIWQLFRDQCLLTAYSSIIARTRESLKDLDNANTIEGLRELRCMIRGDRYLTAAAVTGLDVAVEDDQDLLSCLEEEG